MTVKLERRFSFVLSAAPLAKLQLQKERRLKQVLLSPTFPASHVMFRCACANVADIISSIIKHSNSVAHALLQCDFLFFFFQGIVSVPFPF